MRNLRIVLVIGASGYVGRHLCRLLSQRHKVYGTYFRHPVNLPGESVYLDIRDKQAVEALFQRIKPELIYHLAYDPEDLDASIVVGTRNLLKASAQWCPTSPFIFISTDAVFDGENGPYKEEDVPRPIWEYGEIKRRAEVEVLGSCGILVRISLVYGFDPQDPRTKSLQRGIETGNFEHSYFKDEIRCPTFVEDLCAALMEIGEGKAGDKHILHVAGPEAINRYEFAKKLARIMGYDEKRIPKGSLSESALIRPRDVSLDINLAKSILKTKLRKVDECDPQITQITRIT